MGKGHDNQRRTNDAFRQFCRYVFGVGQERNIGGVERALRYSFGILLLLAGVTIALFPVFTRTLTRIALAVSGFAGGLFVIYEAQVQYCPFNKTVDRSTYPGGE